MIEKLIQKIDKHIFKIMKNGLKFSFVLAIISVIILLTYNLAYPLPVVYYIGFTLLKSSIFFAVFFIIFAIGFNSLNLTKQEK